MYLIWCLLGLGMAFLTRWIIKKGIHTKKPLKIGIATAGIKDVNNRGITIMANGPRMPEYLNYIESKIKQSVFPLESDANMCIWGEEYALDGALRNINNAYYDNYGEWWISIKEEIFMYNEPYLDGHAVSVGLLDHGVYAKETHHSTVRLAPALTINESQIDILSEAIRSVVKSL